MRKIKKTVALVLACAFVFLALPTNHIYAVASSNSDSAKATTGGAVGTEGLVYQCYASVNYRPYCGYVTGYTGTEKNVVIPSQHNGYTIIGIKFNAFQNNTNITTVTIPDTVESINGYAFSGCTALKNVHIPNSVTDMSGNGIFKGCTSLESITIPDSVTKIGKDMFSQCDNLKKVSLGNQITTIPSQIFYSCDNLVEVNIPNTVTEIGTNAFSHCVNLESVLIPKTVTTINSSAFVGCTNLTIYCEAESQPGTWSSSWNYSNCPVVYGREISSLEITNMPSKTRYLKGVDDLDVTGGTLLVTYKNGDAETINITEGMITGFDNQLVGTQSLTVNYGGKATSYDVEVYVEILEDGICGAEAFWNLESSGLLTISGTGPLESYAINETPWHEIKEQITTVVISDGITAIGENAFAECSNINAIYIPFSVTIIDNAAIAPNENLIIYSYYNTIAEEYAQQNNIDFQLISELNQITATEPVKTFYKEGDTFDPAGIVVTISYTDGTTETINDYIIGEFNSVVGKQRVSISYKNLSTVVLVEVTPYSGSGTEEDPFLIENKYQLDQVRNYFRASFKLMNDIVFTEADFKYGGDYYNSGDGWNPIGLVAFYGTFDGNGFEVKNLKGNISSTSDSVEFGLFKANHGTIKNLGIVNCQVHITTSDNVYASAGCITVGNSQDAVISNCYATGDISIDSGAYAYAGGIVASNTGRIENCYSGVNISSESTYYERYAGYYAYAGGIAAVNEAYSYNNVRGEIINCYNTGNLFASSEGHANGIAGIYVGGIVAECNGLVQNCYNIGNLSGMVNNQPETKIGGIIGELRSSGVAEGCYYLDNNDLAVGKSYGTYAIIQCTAQEMRNQETFGEYDFDTVWEIDRESNYWFPKLRSMPAIFTRQLLNIELESAPNRITYLDTKGAYDISGGNIIVNYTGGSYSSVKIMPTMVTNTTESKAGDVLLTITYKDQSVTVETYVFDYLLGDTNGDDCVDGVDRANIARYLANWDGYTGATIDLVPADVNCDSQVDSLDRLILARHLANWVGYEDLAALKGN